MSTANSTTVRIAHIIDQLCTAIDAARISALHDSRWSHAIETAADWLLQQDAVEYDRETHALTIESATRPGTFYTANGSCGCEAFASHNACWHRAAARLVRRATEVVIVPVVVPVAPTVATLSRAARQAQLEAEVNADLFC